MVAVVSIEDFDRSSRYNWYAANCARYGGDPKFYARRKLPGGGIEYLHRMLMRPPHGMVVDHFPDNDGLNCQRENMRVVSQRENTAHCRFRKRADAPAL